MQSFNEHYRIEDIKNIRLTEKSFYVPFENRQVLRRRHNIALVAGFDSVNSRKALTLKFYFQNKIV